MADRLRWPLSLTIEEEDDVHRGGDDDDDERLRPGLVQVQEHAATNRPVRQSQAR
jgi:hypothetical protein